MPGNALGNLVHCVAKAAVIRMTQALAIELAPCSTRVNSVPPGVIDTPSFDRFSATRRTPRFAGCLRPSAWFLGSVRSRTW
jgi:NAD(P)-dependent dehydrogenase (short-subunit alcohol dehydrogenase family)